MITLHQSATSWLALLPETVITLRRTLDNIKDPLYRYFEREVNSGSVLLRHVRNDLTDVLLICKVSVKLIIIVCSYSFIDVVPLSIC